MTVTLLRDYLQQQHSSISQQLQGVLSPGGSLSPGGGGSPGRFDLTSPLKLNVSVASAGTQTSPCRPLTSSGIAGLVSAAAAAAGGRNISSSIAQVSSCWSRECVYSSIESVSRF